MKTKEKGGHMLEGGEERRGRGGERRGKQGRGEEKGDEVEKGRDKGRSQRM